MCSSQAFLSIYVVILAYDTISLVYTSIADHQGGPERIPHICYFENFWQFSKIFLWAKIFPNTKIFMYQNLIKNNFFKKFKKFLELKKNAYLCSVLLRVKRIATIKRGI